MSEIPGFKELLDEKYRIHKAKNSDYAGDADPFKNFKLCETLGICSVEQGILVRITDKMSRLSTLIASGKDPAVLDEKKRDTALDASNYFDILNCWWDHQEKEAKK